MHLEQLTDEITAGVRLSERERELLDQYARSEATALGIADALEHWRDPNPSRFTKSQRPHTTIWNAGLSWTTDLFVAAALRGIGYVVRTLPVPDNEALRLGKEFGNRGQCNPTYFTVGNLVKHLQNLEKSGLSREEIVRDHAFVTAGACGPCRFGTYVTEYRKALRDAGFEGFRVLLFQQQEGLQQATGEEYGLEANAIFYKAIIGAFLAGDVINLMGYRIRPYEVTPGSTDAAVQQSQEILIQAFEEGRSIVRALLRCRKLFAAIEVDRLRPKPVVSVIGEFWAMTTEGDGNYHLQRYLEQQGAEVAIQPLVNWILFIIWEQTRDTVQRMRLRREDGGRKGLANKDEWDKLWKLYAAHGALLVAFRSFANAIGLRGYRLPNMNDLAAAAHEHYDNELRGGEAHMEVGKLIHCVKDQDAHMVISVKPFGCMPSSGISDGVQSKIQTLYPDALFLAIETSGDGEVNVLSRVQMQLFKAHQRARDEYERVLADCGVDTAEAERRIGKRWRLRRTLHTPPHRVAGSAANRVLEAFG